MKKAIAAAFFAALLAGCGSSTQSLQGTWEIEGSATPSLSQTLTFTRMDFKADGTVTGTLLPQPPMMIGMAGPAARAKAIAPQPFTFSYVIDKPGSVILREPSDSTALTITYEIKGSELYLTVPIMGAPVLHVYKRTAG